jgi:hypothetical protein
MKALALEAPDGERVVLVTSDSQGVPKEMTDRVFAELKKEYNLERRLVMITFTTTAGRASGSAWRPGGSFGPYRIVGPE